MLNKLETAWDFVQKYYPNYYHCDEIAHNDDLTKIIDDEINGEAEVIYNEIAEDLKGIFPYHNPDEREEYRVMIKKEAQRRLNESYVAIYEAAIEGFIEEQKSYSDKYEKEAR